MTKRVVDVVGASLGLLVAAIPMALIAVVIRVTMGRPVLFRQLRPGRHEQPFTNLKFRTMREPRGDETSTASDAERITRVGAWLRRTSLDELPELVNVLHGEMSLVGPRPLLLAYLDRYSPEQRRRHEVKPGITGLAQISGRNDLMFEEQFALDVRYVDEQSLALDLQILARTVRVVLGGGGITQPGHATRDEFQG